MKLKIFKKFIFEVVREGNRLQRLNIKGDIIHKRNFTDTQLIAILIASISVFILPKGFSGNFAGFMISFMGIFIGLFSTIVISLYDKSKKLFKDYSTLEEKEKARIKLIRNYMVQFTGLTSYSILLALVLVILLFVPLLTVISTANIYNYSFVSSFNEINSKTLLLSFKVLTLLTYRWIIIYLIINFFVITIFSITSYFSFLLSEYNKIGENS